MDVGLVGCGVWGANILRDLRLLECDVRVVARSDASVARAREGGAVAVVREIAELGPVDAIVAVTPIETHAAVLEEALAAGVPVFVEKPLCDDAVKSGSGYVGSITMGVVRSQEPSATISAVVAPSQRAKILERIRMISLALPETSERSSHGAPTFFVRGKRAFLMMLTDHHGDGRFAIWCAAPAGAQSMLAENDSEKFFVPPYVGHRGWLGVRLDRELEWDELEGIVEDAYAEVAPAKLVEAARLDGSSDDT